MISVNDLKPGVTIELDGQAYHVIESAHHKPGKGQAVVRTRLRDIETGKVFNKTFTAQVKVAKAHVERREAQYLYSQGDVYVLMDTQSYEQFEFSRAQVGDVAKWFKEGEAVLLVSYNGKLLGIEPPGAVERQVVKTDPGLRGDTAQGGTKPAMIEGGVMVTVPLFVDQGEIIRVDTATGEYMERVR